MKVTQRSLGIEERIIPMENEMEYGPDILTLTDEDGQEHEFELIDSLEENETQYVALVPYYENPEDSLDDSGELVILRVTKDEGEEEILESIEDDDEFDRIAAIFTERLSEFYDIEE